MYPLRSTRARFNKPADSICHTGARLSRISGLILPVGCDTCISPVRLDLHCRSDSSLGSPYSLICSRVRPGQTPWCCSPVSSSRPAGALSQRRCASWGEIAIPTSAPSTVSSIGQRGRREPRRAVCCSSWSTPSCPQEPRWCCVKKAGKRHAVREMKEDPSEPLCRRRLQTAMSCFGQKPR
jgi:hypothetical protein